MKQKYLVVMLTGLAMTQLASAGVIIDANTRGGGFEGSSKKRYVAPWVGYGEVLPSKTQVKTGEYALGLGQKQGVVKGIYQNTEHTVGAADTFALTFSWAAGFKWSKKSSVTYTLFTTADGTYGGARTIVMSGSVSGKFKIGEYGTPVNFKSSAIPASSVGKKLWIEFSGSCGEEQYSRLDDVILTVSSPPVNCG